MNLKPKTWTISNTPCSCFCRCLHAKRKKYPIYHPLLIDFNSSGLTHSYTDFKGEPNKYRLGNVVIKKSFGILKFNFKTNAVTMEIRGENNIVFETYTQSYGHRN